MFPNPCCHRTLGRRLGIVFVVCVALPGASGPAHADAVGTIVTIAGGRTATTPGGAFASLAQPRTAAVAANGDIYFTDTYHHQIRRLDRAGVVTTIAGNGSAGYSGDGGPATEASLNTPHGVAVDNRGHAQGPGGVPRYLFVADSPNHRIRRVDLATGRISTVAGTGQEGFSGDGGPATAARLNRPRFLIVAPDGSLIIADTANYRVRRVDPAGVITTIAGTGERGYSGDGDRAIAARLDDPRGLALDGAGHLYVSNAEGSPVPSVRRIDPAGIITTVAGGRPAGFAGDGGPATEARLHEPRSIAVWRSTLYIADSMNDRIRAVDLRTGSIRTLAGTGAAAYGGDGGPADAAEIAEPRGVAVTGDGDVIVVDTGNDRLRHIDLEGVDPPGTPAGAPAPGVSSPPTGQPEAEPGSPPLAPTGSANRSPALPPAPRPTTAKVSSRPAATSPRPATPPTSPAPPASVTSTSSVTPPPTATPAVPGSHDRRFGWRADLGPAASDKPARVAHSSTNESWYLLPLLLLLLAVVPLGYVLAASKAARTSGGISTDSATPGLTET